MHLKGNTFLKNISEDLKKQSAVLQAAQDDLGQLRTQLVEAQADMENIKAIATVSENTKQEAIDEVKRQWQEEVASLQAIMKGRPEGSGITAVERVEWEPYQLTSCCNCYVSFPSKTTFVCLRQRGAAKSTEALVWHNPLLPPLGWSFQKSQVAFF